MLLFLLFDLLLWSRAQCSRNAIPQNSSWTGEPGKVALSTPRNEWVFHHDFITQVATANGTH